MTSQQTFVIVGAGLAGAKAAETLRTRGFDGRIVLLGEEPTRPYQRPPLSKGYLTGQSGLDKVYVHDQDFYPSRAIELRTGTAVTGLHPHAHTVTLAGGEVLRYDKLLLATGATPRRLTVPGADLPGVHHLRTLADADRLVANIDAARSVAVVGAGWIGAEVTASLRQRGVSVALIEAADTPLERVLGREVGEVYRRLHASHGVALHLGETVKSLHGAGHVEEVITTGGVRIGADLVVVGIGALPRVELAAQAGLWVSNGIVVDERLQASRPDVYAAGDVAAAWHPHYHASIRVEHWSNALDQGCVAAANMLGDVEPYTEIPYFYSDQYDLGMEYTGYCPAWDQVIFRGDPAAGKFIAFWLSKGRVAAAMNANIWDVNERLQQLVRNRARVAPPRLADSDVALDDLVTETVGA